MNVLRKTLLPGCALGLVLVVLPRPARATWIEGKVFCDDGDAQLGAGDAPVDGVMVGAVSQHAGTSFTDTTGDGVPVSPAVPGYYRILLPQVSDTYTLAIRSGLPPGAGVLLPDGGAYSVEIVSGSGDPANARKTRNFLLRDCRGSTTTTTIRGASTTSTSSTTPTTASTSTSTTPTTGQTSTSTMPTTGSSSTTTMPTTPSTSTSTTPTTGQTSTSTTPTTGSSSTTTMPTTGHTSTSTTLTTGNTSTTTTTSTGNTTTTTAGGPGGIPVPPHCGDGVLDPDEECDDGNRADGDGCGSACAAEDTAETWKLSLRVRPLGVERLRYYTLFREVPSALLGSVPVHVTLSSRGFQMLDADIPASAFKVKPKPTLAQPDGRLAKAEGDFGIWHIRLVLKPVTGVRAYDVKLIVKGEMLPEMFARLYLTAVFRIGSVVYTATDPIRANPPGKILRYIHPPIRDKTPG